MFSKTALILLALGALYANALTVPTARSPAPEPEFQDLPTRVNFDPVKRENLVDLFSREPNGKPKTPADPPSTVPPTCPTPYPEGKHPTCRYEPSDRAKKETKPKKH